MSNADGTGFFLYDPSNAFSITRRTANTAAVTFEAIEQLNCVASGSKQSLASLTLLEATAVGVLSASYFYDFYFRIWVVPGTFNLQSPQRNSAIPYGIWNAYPTPATNILEVVAQTGSAGVDTNAVAPITFGDLQYQMFNLIFTNLAPIVVNSTITFTFSTGSGTLQIHATLATSLSAPPEQPVEETWEFLSDILISKDSTEQRIALRSAPRRTLKYDTVLLNPADYQEVQRLIWSSLAGTIIIPFFQYLATVNVATAPGSNAIFLDPTTTDLQVGDYVYVASKGSEQIAKVVTIQSNYITIDAPMGFALSLGDTVVPAFTCYVADKTGVKMKGYQVGQINIGAETNGPPHATMSRPGSNTVFTEVNGLIVLDKVPLGNSEDDFSVFTGGEMLDFKTGITVFYTSYKTPKFMGKRQWLIRRYLRPAEMDYWRDFAQATNGQQNAFLMPTYRPDFEQFPGADFSLSSVTLDDTSYSSLFFNVDPTAMGYMALNTDQGWQFVKVISVANDPIGGGDVVNFSPALNSITTVVNSVSLMIRCRLSSDTISLTHSSLDSMIEFDVMSTAQ